MLHPHTEIRLVNPHVGLGVFATRDLPRGTIVWIRDPLDQVYTPEQVAAFQGPIRDSLFKYSFVDGSGCSILCWDLSKYVNHSCEANLLSTAYEFEIAVRDIAAGEQLTDDYGSFNIEEPLTCCCGSKECRGTVQADDAETQVPFWDERIRAAFPDLLQVEQPLWVFVNDPQRVQAAARNPETLPSVIANYVGTQTRAR